MGQRFLGPKMKYQVSNLPVGEDVILPVSPDDGVRGGHVVDQAGDVELALRLDVEVVVPQDLHPEAQYSQPQHSVFLQEQGRGG